jgi:hypothetical protein
MNKTFPALQMFIILLMKNVRLDPDSAKGLNLDKNQTNPDPQHCLKVATFFSVLWIGIALMPIRIQLRVFDGEYEEKKKCHSCASHRYCKSVIIFNILYSILKLSGKSLD